MLHDLPVRPHMQAGSAGIDELDPLDLQAHRPLHEGRLAAERNGAGLEKIILTAAYQALLGNDVGLDASFSWVGSWKCTFSS